MDWAERLLSIVDKRLGKTTSNIILWIITLGVLAAGLLWFVTYSIGRIDLLAERFDINIIPSIIKVVSFGDYVSVLLIGIAIIIFILASVFAIAMPILLIVRVGIDASQRGKVERLLNGILVILTNVKSSLPQEINELEIAINKIEQIKRQPSLFRRLQNMFSLNIRKKENG